MKRNSVPRPEYLLALICLVGAALSGSQVYRMSAHLPLRPAANNPDQFYLWAAGSNVHHAFTYDPLAADMWMFDSAEGWLPEANLLSPTRPDDSINFFNAK